MMKSQMLELFQEAIQTDLFVQKLRSIVEQNGGTVYGEDVDEILDYLAEQLADEPEELND